MNSDFVFIIYRFSKTIIYTSAQDWIVIQWWADLEILGQSSWEKSKIDNEEQGDFLIIYRFLAEQSY